MKRSAESSSSDDESVTRPRPLKRPGTGIQFILKLAAFCDESIDREEFIEAWHTYESTVGLEDLLHIMLNGTQEGKRVIWLLADAATKGAPEPFLGLWEKYQDSLPLSALLESIEDGPDKGISVFWLLAYCASDHPQLFLAVWHKHHQDIPLEALSIPVENGIFVLCALVIGRRCV